MAIDPSIPLGFKTPTPVNPLDTITQMIQARNGLNQNALFQGQQAIGQNYQAATNPDGSIDPQKLAQLNAQTPAAAIALPDATTKAQALQTAQQNRSFQSQTRVNQALISLGTLPDSQMNPQTVKSTLDQLVAGGSISSADEQAALAGVPPAGSDPTAFRQFIFKHAVANLGGPDAVQQIYGSSTEQAVGNGIVSGVTASPGMSRVNPQQGVGFQPRTVTPTNLSPGQQIQPIEIKQPDGTVKTYLGGQLMPPNGSMGNGTYPGATSMPSALLNPNRQGVPAAPGAPSAPSAPSAPGMAPAMPAPVGSSQPPDQQAAAAARGAASAGAFADIATQGVAARGQNAILGNMLGDAQQFTTGAGLNSMKTAFQRYAPPLAAAFGLDPAKIAANESFDKLAAQIATQQGASSDARLAVTQHANPNSSLTPAGVDLIVRQLQGNGDYLTARSSLAAAYPNQADRAGFESQVASQIDPRAFQYDRLTPPQKAAYFTSLSPTDRAAVKRSYGFAQSAHLLSSQNGQ